MPYQKLITISFLFFFIFLLSSLKAQEIQNTISPKPQDSIQDVPRFTTAFYFELGGNGIAGSLSLEEKFYNTATLRIGVGGFGRVHVHKRETSSSTYNAYIWKPVVVVSSSYLFFGPEKFLEAGFGVTIQPPTSQRLAPYIHDNVNAILPTMTLGYRYQPLESGFMFRVFFSPFIASTIGAITPYGGLSIGHTF